MCVSTPTPAPASTRRGYHHGDLRSALVSAAERLLAERAGSAFTLREVARAAGVSHNAPYNHFADRQALLAAVAAQGFDALARAQRAALAPEPPATAAALRAAARAYLAFAAENPARYRLMFSGELIGCAEPALRASGAEAFGILSDLIAQAVAAGRFRPDPAATHALTAWALVHGLAMLVLDGRVAVAPEALAGLADTVGASLIAGLDARA